MYAVVLKATIIIFGLRLLPVVDSVLTSWSKKMERCYTSINFYKIMYRKIDKTRVKRYKFLEWYISFVHNNRYVCLHDAMNDHSIVGRLWYRARLLFFSAHLLGPYIMLSPNFALMWVILANHASFDLTAVPLCFCVVSLCYRCHRITILATSTENVHICYN